MLGAYCKATSDFVSLENLETAIKYMFGQELAEKNIKAVRKAYDKYKIADISELITN